MESDIFKSKSLNHNHSNIYKLSFILKVVRDIEHGKISLKGCRRKYGILGHSTVRRWLDKYSQLDWSSRRKF